MVGPVFERLSLRFAQMFEPNYQCAAPFNFSPSSGARASGGSFERPAGGSNSAVGCGPGLTSLHSQRTDEALPFAFVNVPASRIGIPSALSHSAPSAWPSGTDLSIAYFVVAMPLTVSW